MSNHPLWWNGPQWLQHKARWPPDIVPNAYQETLVEAKATRHVFAVAIAETDELDTLFEKFSYSKVKRICSWIMRFIRNARSAKMRRLTGPLTTEETNKANAFWVKRVQTKAPLDKYYQEDQLQLNLKPNSEGVLECRGRIQGHYPVYLPVSRRYTEKFVTQAHLATLRGGVVSTMAKVREQYWVPRLRRLTKRVVKNCLGCRRFQVQAFSSPRQGTLPKDRTEGQTPFQVVGVNYAGPLKYRKGAKTEGISRCTPVAWLMPCSWICYPVWKLQSSSQVSNVSLPGGDYPKRCIPITGKLSSVQPNGSSKQCEMRSSKISSPTRGSSGNSFWVVRPGGEDNSREWWDCSKEPFTSPLETGCCPSLNFKKYCWA